jgi:hypothetical protein
MFSVLFHPEIGDTPGSALVMWLLVAGFVALIIVAVYFVVKLLRSLFKRGR